MGKENGSVGILAEDIIRSDDWELINVLMTASGWSKVKGRRITVIEGGLNYAVAWIETENLKVLYRTKFGSELQDFNHIKKEDYGASFGMGN